MEFIKFDDPETLKANARADSENTRRSNVCSRPTELTLQTNKKDTTLLCLSKDTQSITHILPLILMMKTFGNLLDK